MDDMDDMYANELQNVVPYAGPIIDMPDIIGILSLLNENASKMRHGDFNPAHTRKLLLGYLAVCNLMPFASSCSFLRTARNVLICHAMSMPAGKSLSDDDPKWRELVFTKLTELGAGDYPRPLVCETSEHYPDHLWYVYSVTIHRISQLWVVDYFSRSKERSIYTGRIGILSDTYARCDCGRWASPYYSDGIIKRL